MAIHRTCLGGCSSYRSSTLIPCPVASCLGLVKARPCERVTGDIPLTYLCRVADDSGEPVGYQQVMGVEMLGNDQIEAYTRLPERFRFRDAKAIYGRGDQATNDCLKKLISLRLVQKEQKTKEYFKLANASPRPAQEAPVMAEAA